jgi:hypothetical protein
MWVIIWFFEKFYGYRLKNGRNIARKELNTRLDMLVECVRLDVAW